MTFATLDNRVDYDPALHADDAAWAAWLRRVPARWVVYLLSAADDRPVQLLCVKDLRASLARRLADGSEDAGPSRRIDYRQLVRGVHYRRVDSAFEADLVYSDLARRLFPEDARRLAETRTAWWLHVDRDAPFPRYVRTADLSDRPGELFGPLEDRTSAGRLVEQIEDWFDLCRYYNVLIEAPHGKACAYKEMGRCPAPCDGSVSVEQYRKLIELSVRTLRDPLDYIREHEQRMKQAAGELKFEVAARIRQYVDSLSVLGRGPYRHLRRLRDFRFLSLQRGPTARTAKVFLVTPGRVEQVASLSGAPSTATGLIRLALSSAEEWATLPLSAEAVGRVGLVTHHLFARKPSGVFIPLDRLDDRALDAAYRELGRQKVSDVVEGEGVVQEVQPSG